jgi:primosomal protein N' (replication factor Y)
MIKINIKHRDKAQLNHFSDLLGHDLKEIFGKRVLGPESPVISQVQSWYIKTILIKIERERPSARAKQFIAEVIEKISREKGASALRIAVDVDPY